MIKTKIIALSILLGISLALSAQSFDKQKIDSLFSIIENNDKGMGSISIFHEGKEVYQNSYGYADIENKVKNNSLTKFRIGSITKTFTATIIMKLIENNKLTLSTKLSHFYPQIKNSNEITIEELLRHRSGIANITSAKDYMQWNDTKQTKEQMISKIESFGTSFKPNEKFEYSNSNYMLLTFIAEEVSEKKFSELLHDIITKPCDLKNTFVGKKIDVLNNEALSYNKLHEWKLEKETDMSITLGAGNIISTPSDINKFLNCLFEGKIIGKDSLNKMTTLMDNFGFGLFQIPFYNIKGYGHTGGIDGFQSLAIYMPEQKTSIAITANRVNISVSSITKGILSIYFGKEYELPQFNEEIAITSEELDKYIGIYSSNAIPIKLTISKKDNVLITQGTGQPSLPLEYIGNNKFKFDSLLIELEFFPEDNKMILKQNGMTFEMKKE